MRTLFFSLTALLLCASGSSHAVYRCDMDGRTAYSDQPCAGAGARKLDITAAPPDAANNARRIEKEVADGKKQLQKLEADRQKEEAAAGKQRQRAAKQQAALDKRCTSLERRQRLANEDAAAASGKTFDKARKKASRATEAYEQECSVGKRIRPMQAS